MESETSSLANYRIVDGASRLAKELRNMKLDPRSRVIDVPDVAIEIWDALVSIVDRMLDDSGHGSLEDRITAALERTFGGPISEDALVQQLEHFATYMTEFGTDNLQLLIKKLKRPSFVSFLRRILGAALFDRLSSALQHDLGILIQGMRRIAKAVMPFAVALEDLAEILTPTQLTEFQSLKLSQRTLLSVTLTLDRALENKLQSASFLEDFTTRQEGPSETIDPGELKIAVAQMRDVISGRSLVALEKLNSSLTRKVQGARDALTYSADPVSQAATSLIELIDRLLREAFTEQEVLTWLDTRNLPKAGLVYVEQHTSSVRPTKRAQALCFTYGGSLPPEPSPLHELAATAIVATRTKLQQLKHADTGTPEETVALAKYIAAVEGYLFFAINIGWAGASTRAIENLDKKVSSPIEIVEGVTE